MRPGNGFQECQIGSWRGRAITFDDQTHFDTTPPDLNRNVAPDYHRGLAFADDVLRSAHRGGRIHRYDLTHHQPVEQMPDGGQALEPLEARALLDSIDVTTPIGLRDRALIGLMVYSFARIGAALSMKVEDTYSERRRLWVRLREKGGKRHEMPCHHNLETYLTAYIEKTGIADDPKGPLFRTSLHLVYLGKSGGTSCFSA
jgi:integrase